jgi:hypothetical protein
VIGGLALGVAKKNRSMAPAPTIMPINKKSKERTIGPMRPLFLLEGGLGVRCGSGCKVVGLAGVVGTSAIACSLGTVGSSGKVEVSASVAGISGVGGGSVGTDVTSGIPGSVDALDVSELVFSSAIGFSSDKLFIYSCSAYITLIEVLGASYFLEEIY